ncbi:MAG: hypothetical protein ACI8P0_000343 [Planctomycetaceae bacterium]|jgi:hypothetical protein
MKRSLLILAAVMACSLTTAMTRAEDAVQNVPPKGFTALFNGKSLDGWIAHNQSPYKLDEMAEEARKTFLDEQWKNAVEHWSVDKGELVNDGKGVYMTSPKEYRDFELVVDFKLLPKGDSGVYLKATPQVQIWDTTEEAGYWRIGANLGSGGLWNNAKDSPGKDPIVNADKPIGEWNSFRIKQIGARTWVWLNGKLAVDGAALQNYWKKGTPLRNRGPIQLQTHGNEVRWRNIFIREISLDEATQTLAGSDGEFKTIFDGKSLEGWGGPIENYEVVDGTVRCKQGKGGTIYYDENLTDFVARLEFKVPPGGNNGLAIRYPGKGDTAYVGLCELQVLDNTAEKYDGKLDARQYHGSVYGVVAAHRGYQRPVGEWNYQEVTVKGSWVKVELNGSVIVDADVTKPEEHMGGKRHIGIDRFDGYFGFAGHGDAVQYRNVSLKKLAPANETPAENKPPVKKAEPAADEAKAAK